MSYSKIPANLCYLSLWTGIILFSTFLIVIYSGPYFDGSEGSDGSDGSEAKIIDNTTLLVTSSVLLGIVIILDIPKLIINLKESIYSEKSQTSVTFVNTALLNFNMMYILRHQDVYIYRKIAVNIHVVGVMIANICLLLHVTRAIYIKIYTKINPPVVWTNTKPDIIYNNDEYDISECSICLTDEKNVIYSCGHYICCDTCAQNIYQITVLCPLCKKVMLPMYKFESPINKVRTTYLTFTTVV